ncbi:hypothetical protein NLI96_g12792 [Meripilus lineatus]|uniref:Uncharacterized protein n=1 Tax=Meripilus lineatus TaxID=2056292 RepID=A0AAD5UTX5_9APHY|nr:hypothetical protein NLI96_g12792 [Physisporinus lineatus]
MKLTCLLVASLALVVSTHAQYFSDGWQPGQTVTQDVPAPEYTPGAQPPDSFEARAPPPARPPKEPLTWSTLSVSRILETDTVSSLFGKLGLNISEQLEAAKARAELWDKRIPLITDDNYDELIVNEELTPDELEKRVWFVVITAQAGQMGTVSKIIDESFDAAYNNSLFAKDLPDVRWGRVDYLNVTYLTTKWNIWQAPYLAVIKDRGRTLYFYRANQVRLTPEIMHDFLEEQNWRKTEPWTSSFAPGGRNEYLLHYFALFCARVYNTMIVVPKWILMIASGAIGSVLMKFMHRAPRQGLWEDEPKKASSGPVSSTSTTTTPKTPTSGPKPILKSAMKRTPASSPGVDTPTTPTASPTKLKSALKSRKTSKR